MYLTSAPQFDKSIWFGYGFFYYTFSTYFAPIGVINDRVTKINSKYLM